MIKVLVKHSKRFLILSKTFDFISKSKMDHLIDYMLIWFYDTTMVLWSDMRKPYSERNLSLENPYIKFHGLIGEQ